MVFNARSPITDHGHPSLLPTIMIRYIYNNSYYIVIYSVTVYVMVISNDPSLHPTCPRTSGRLLPWGSSEASTGKAGAQAEGITTTHLGRERSDAGADPPLSERLKGSRTMVVKSIATPTPMENRG